MKWIVAGIVWTIGIFGTLVVAEYQTDGEVGCSGIVFAIVAWPIYLPLVLLFANP